MAFLTVCAPCTEHRNKDDDDALPVLFFLLRPAAFLSDLLKQLGPRPFARWAYPLALSVVAAATLNPGLYGLYNLAATTLELCRLAGLLETASTSSSSSNSDGVTSQMPVQTSAAAAAAAGGGARAGEKALEQQQLTELFRNFLPQVAASCELLSEVGQTAALELLLSRAALPLLPSSKRSQPLCMALQLGVRYPDAAAVAVSALESWEQQQPQQLQTLLPVVVPLLNPYLQDLSAVQPEKDAAGLEGFDPATSADNDNDAADDGDIDVGVANTQGSSKGSNSSKLAGVHGSSAAADQAKLYRAEMRQALAERKSKGAARKVWYSKLERCGTAS
jgi:hypothetical protein